jgi:uncharacterized protein
MSLARLPQQGLIALVQAYRLLFRHWVGPVCRYEPSCSTYALQALQQHGAWRGGRLSAWRVMRCNPWCLGGHDPVPPPQAAGPVPSPPVEPSAPAASAADPTLTSLPPRSP